ncbi:MAG: hypothetical protein MJD61_16815 [Proteobacteria bacterium]|nr:hypothetical protein [Pseudomonadota bacterium]
MKNANSLERAVVERFLCHEVDRVRKPGLDFDKVPVRSREFTGAGFLTEFEKCEELHLFDNSVSDRLGKIGAKLGESKVDTGYLFYIDEGYLTTVEGYSYGDEWPNDIEKFELYDLEVGSSLT